MLAAPLGSRLGGQMEVSHTSSPSHDAPTEGDDGLSGAIIANLYIALRCVFEKDRKEGKEMLCVIGEEKNHHHSHYISDLLYRKNESGPRTGP